MKFLDPKFRDRLLPITLSQTLGLLCGLAGVKIATHFVSPQDYGAFGVFCTFTPLGIWVVHAGLITFTGRHWAASPNRGALLHEVLRAGIRKMPWLILATLGATLLSHSHQWLVIWITLLSTASLLSVGMLTQTALQAEQNHWMDFAVTASGSLTRSFIPPLLYALVGGSLLALQAGFCVHAGVFACGFLYLKHKYKGNNSPADAQLTAVYEGPLFVLLSLAGWAMTGVNRWIVAGFFGAEKAGYFTLASNIAMVATGMLGSIFVQYFQPEFFLMASEEPALRRKLGKRVDTIAVVYWFLAMTGVIALRLLAPWLINPLISPKYRPAIDMVVAAGFFGTAMVTAQFYHTLLLAGRRETSCVSVDLTTALLFSLGGVAAALLGERWFILWLIATPMVPWLITRPLARFYYFKLPPAGPSTTHR